MEAEIVDLFSLEYLSLMFPDVSFAWLALEVHLILVLLLDILEMGSLQGYKSLGHLTFSS